MLGSILSGGFTRTRCRLHAGLLSLRIGGWPSGTGSDNRTHNSDSRAIQLIEKSEVVTSIPYIPAIEAD